jgi:hypothetical protein
VRWLEHYREFWETRLDALESFLVRQEQGTAPPRARGRGKAPA